MGQVGPRDNLWSSPFSLHPMIDITTRLRLLWPPVHRAKLGRKAQSGDFSIAPLKFLLQSYWLLR